MLAASCSRFAREVIDLSRTEIGEVAEVDGHHRGASSTMPQKVNPISSEAVVGMAAAASALASAATRAMEAGHERAAGEWQVEWHVVPQLAVLAASALRTTGHIVDGLRVDREAMRRNVVDGVGLLMAEAYMMRVAELLGRERAHDLVYEAAREARTTRIDLEEALRQVGARHGEPVLLRLQPIAPEEYLGEAQRICDVALRDWRRDAPPSEPEAVPDGRHATVPAVAALPEEER
jgi:3-carboxy-cis,cis-muconate cycloisomerase